MIIQQLDDRQIIKLTAHEIRHYARIGLSPHIIAHCYSGERYLGDWDYPNGLYRIMCVTEFTATAPNLRNDRISIPQLAYHLKTVGVHIPDLETIELIPCE